MTDPDEWRSVPPEDNSGDGPEDGTGDRSADGSDGGFEDAADDVPEIANPYADAGLTHPGPAESGFAPPGFTPPGFAQPDFAQPDFAQPGFGHPAPGPELVTAPAQPVLGAALRWTWSRLTAAPGTIIGAGALWGIIVLALVVVASLAIEIVAAHNLGKDVVMGDAVFPVDVAIIGFVVMTVVMSVIMALAMSCWLHGLLRVADGQRPVLADFFRPVAFGPILGVSLITGLLDAAADIVLTDVLGLGWASTPASLVIGFFALWMIFVAADLRTGTIDALRTGLDLSLRRPGPTVVVLAMTILLTLLGILALLVGLLVTMPLVGLMTIYYFRSLTARPLAR